MTTISPFSLLTNFYRALPDRSPYPPFYLPLTFTITILPLLTPHRRLMTFLTFPLLISLCLLAPSYTYGSPSDDYYNTSPFIALPLWYLDFILLSPTSGPDAPQYIGNRATANSATGREKTNKDEKIKGVSWQDIQQKPLSERIKWSLRLMLPAHRGIGWNWQVKNVPPGPWSGLPKWRFVSRHARKAVFWYLQSVLMLGSMGFLSSVFGLSGIGRKGKFVRDALMGWCGAVWVWDRLSCAYSLAAGVSVAVGICETWEWPPLMGDLKDAWSVRRMWSAVYHQTLRRALQQPPLRLVRSLHLRKGSLPSKYTQLYLSFLLSCIFHQYQMYNITRKDMGEFKFFMAQPVAITIEDFVIWLWTRNGKPRRDEKVRWIGYLWVFCWFSWSLPVYIGALKDCGMLSDWILDGWPMQKGEELGIELKTLMG